MENRMGCLGFPLSLFRPEHKEESPHRGSETDFPEEEHPMIESPTPSVEIFAMPGHGRTSFLWAMLFQLRQLSRAWPSYLCWPLDESTGKSLLDIHERLRLGQLPERSVSDGGSERRYALHLRNMNPWGERYFIVCDTPDPVFTASRFDADSNRRPIDWNRPALWLLSLSDLDETRGRFLDLSLDELVRARRASGESAREYPFRLILVLTKGDTVTDLPPELRCFLREDPLAKALASGPDRLFRADDGIDLSPPPDGPDSYPEGDPLNAYFSARRRIDEATRDWLSSNSAGRALLGRAQDLNVEIRFSVVSATGSGLISGQRLATAWSPRRVLDPYFWSLELGG